MFGSFAISFLLVVIIMMESYQQTEPMKSFSIDWQSRRKKGIFHVQDMNPAVECPRLQKGMIENPSEEDDRNAKETDDP